MDGWMDRFVIAILCSALSVIKMKLVIPDFYEFDK